MDAGPCPTDEVRRDAFAAAINIAVERIRGEAKDVRVLNLGCGAGLLAMEALRAGAHHVTATDRWLYHAMARGALRTTTRVQNGA